MRAGGWGISGGAFLGEPVKKQMIFVVALGLTALGSSALADHHRAPTVLGPGAAHLAAQASVQTDEAYVLRHDPSGAPMCFDAAGAKAPIVRCQADETDSDELEYIVALDPTGAPMCFDLAGSKAPLSACEVMVGAHSSSAPAQLASR